MFETQISIDQQDLETQQSLPIPEIFTSSNNFTLQIDSLGNILQIDMLEDELNEISSQNGIYYQVISESSEQNEQIIYPKDVVFTTYHPLALFGKKKYDTYKSVFQAELIAQNNSEGFAEEDCDITNYIYSNLAQIESKLKTCDNGQRNLAQSEIDSIFDKELDDIDNHDVEQKIQNYNSNCNILEKFQSSYKY